MRSIIALLFAIIWVAVPALAQDKAWLGAETRDLTKAQADALGWDEPRGAWGVSVAKDGPAAKAGVLVGDVIVSLDGQEIKGRAGLEAAVEAKAVGAAPRLRYWRNKREKRPVTVALVAAPKPVEVAQIPNALQLMLDSGGHMSLITGLAWTPDGKQIISSGNDKVIRVWDAETGRTVRTVRGEIGPSFEGQIFAMALSPDGRWLAVGGWLPGGNGLTGAIRIYDFATGELLALLRGHTNVVLSLAFAPDRRRLISGGAYGRAILWDVGDWGQAKRADARPRLLHKLEGHKDDVIAVGFTPDGARALTGSFDTTLRLWDAATGKPVDASMTGQKNKVRALAVNPRDGSIVSGGDDGEIRVWNGTTGKFRRPLANIDGVIGTLTFNSDGTRLLASCGQRCKSDYGLVFAIDSGKEITRYTAHNNVVLAAAISPDGRWAATGGSDNHEIHIWALDTGERRRGPDGQSLMLGGSGALGQAAGFSADGRSVAWGNTSTVVGLVDRRPLEYQLRLPGGGASLGRPERITAPNPLPIEGQTMGRGDAPAPAFLGARVGHGAWSLVHRPGGTFGDNDATLDIRQDGKAVASITRGPSDGYVHRAYSFSTDGNAIVSAGANGILIAYDLAGKELAHFVGHEGDVRAVTPSADGRYLISASADQTIRLWPLSSLSGSGSAPIVIRPIVTLFHGRDGEWVMWTPEGYYTASARGSDLIGWQINKGADKVPEHVTAGQLRQWFNRPDIVDKAILLASSAEAVRTSNGTSFKLEDLIRRPAPRLALLSPTVNATVSGGKIAVKFRIDPTPDPVKAIRVQVNGRQVRLDEPPTGAGGFQPGERTVEVPLASGRNTLQIALLNDVGWSSAEAGTLVKVDQRRDIGMQ